MRTYDVSLLAYSKIVFRIWNAKRLSLESHYRTAVGQGSFPFILSHCLCVYFGFIIACGGRDGGALTSQKSPAATMKADALGFKCV